jgi:hypothetical protein
MILAANGPGSRPLLYGLLAICGPHFPKTVIHSRASYRIGENMPFPGRPADLRPALFGAD